MKKTLIIACLLAVFSAKVKAQFIESGVIEFEVKTSVKKSMGNSSWAESMKDKLPPFKTSYFSNFKKKCESMSFNLKLDIC